ncbi:MAG: UBP-type zinc finger domain-containing protein [Ilumatobacteraceae bacterium]
MPEVTCVHLGEIRTVELPQSIAGCEECLKIGGRWVHLRMCLSCGKIGCCDSSPNRHATAHALGAGHPIVRSAESGEDWSWCYVDQIAFTTPSSPPERAA